MNYVPPECQQDTLLLSHTILVTYCNWRKKRKFKMWWMCNYPYYENKYKRSFRFHPK